MQALAEIKGYEAYGQALIVGTLSKCVRAVRAHGGFTCPSSHLLSFSTSLWGMGYLTTEDLNCESAPLMVQSPLRLRC